MEIHEKSRTAALRSELEKQALGPILPSLIKGTGKVLYHGARGLDIAAKGIGNKLMKPETSKLLQKGLQSSNPYIKRGTELATEHVLPRLAGGLVLTGGAVGAKSMYNSFREGAQQAKANSTRNTSNYTNTGLGPQF